MPSIEYKIKSAELTCISVNLGGMPDDDMPQVAILGRSNVGKSSLINYLILRKRLARTSSTPGKTRTINFYMVNELSYLVDLPGYGYAKASKMDIRSWQKMIGTYLDGSRGLRGLIHLIDSRHPPSVLDIELARWIAEGEIPRIIVATKCDKISRNKLPANLKRIRQMLDLCSDEQLIPFSVTKKMGRRELWRGILEMNEGAP